MTVSFMPGYDQSTFGYGRRNDIAFNPDGHLPSSRPTVIVISAQGKRLLGILEVSGGLFHHQCRVVEGPKIR